MTLNMCDSQSKRLSQELAKHYDLETHAFYVTTGEAVRDRAVLPLINCEKCETFMTVSRSRD